jgi:hypothetical protein
MRKRLLTFLAVFLKRKINGKFLLASWKTLTNCSASEYLSSFSESHVASCKQFQGQIAAVRFLKWFTDFPKIVSNFLEASKNFHLDFSINKS